MLSLAATDSLLLEEEFTATLELVSAEADTVGAAVEHAAQAAGAAGATGLSFICTLLLHSANACMTVL
jgi:hypothetical protein